MDKNDPVVQEFVGYLRLSEEMAAKASRSGFLGYVSSRLVAAARFLQALGVADPNPSVEFL